MEHSTSRRVNFRKQKFQVSGVNRHAAGLQKHLSWKVRRHGQEIRRSWRRQFHKALVWPSGGLC